VIQFSLNPSWLVEQHQLSDYSLYLLHDLQFLIHVEGKILLGSRGVDIVS